jgi:ABC-2 type transport system permease protein
MTAPWLTSAARQAVVVDVAQARPTDRGWAAMWKIEMAKLSAQLTIRLTALACLLAPVVFVIAESVQTAVPADTIFGRWVHESGFAISLVILGFAGQWALPFVVGVLAGAVFADEDRHRTWSLLLTRSRSRGEVLTGKVLAVATYSLGLTLVLAISSTLAGVIGVGSEPLVSLSGAVLPTGDAWQATTASWLTILLPVLAIAAIGVLASVLSRNTWIGIAVPVVLVLVLNLVSLLSALDPIRPLLPTTGLQDWYGLVRDDVYTNQVFTAQLVSAAWIVACLAVGARVFLRRDIVDA